MQEHKEKKLKNDRGDHVLSLINTSLESQAKLFKQIQKELNRMPAGTISSKMINGKKYYYHGTKDNEEQHVQRLIKKDDQDLKESLMRKRFIRKLNNSLQKNVPLMKKFVQTYRPVFGDVEGEMLSEMESEIQLEMAGWMFENDEKILQWISEPFKSNPSFKEGLLHTTTLGLRVRSKSEAIIAGIFEANGIPFRYEAELILGEKVYYPDFTVLCPLSGRVLYWEHFGMLNDSNYRVSAVKKLGSYFENGLYPCDNFIVTYDNVDGSIDASVILKHIDSIVLR